MSDAFDQHTKLNDRIRKTVVSICDVMDGMNPVSRSQAKKVMSRLEKFKTVILDFKDVDTIGQAFADEVFRVFQNKYPEIRITPLRTNKEVSRMIKHVILSTRD